MYDDTSNTSLTGHTRGSSNSLYEREINPVLLQSSVYSLSAPRTDMNYLQTLQTNIRDCRCVAGYISGSSDLFSLRLEAFFEVIKCALIACVTA